MSEQNKDQDKEILRQYLDSIKDKEHRKKLEHIARLSTLNIGLAVFLSLLIPIAGYYYTRRWKALLWLWLGGSIFFIVMSSGSSRNSEKAMEEAFAIGATIGTIVAPIDNALAISRARKQLEDLSK